MTTLSDVKVRKVEALIEQAVSLSRMGFGDEFITVNVGDLRSAFDEAETEFDLLQRGIKYLDPTVAPPEDELQPGQRWIWLPTADPPHYEIMGTGAVVDADVPRTG